MSIIPAASDFQALSDRIHAANVAAGWWSNPATGERIERNVGEMLMLIVSEGAEASVGNEMQLVDDHLPQFKMFNVELGDVLIGVHDLDGGLELDLGQAIQEVHRTFIYLGGRSVDEYLMSFVCHVAYAMEGHRKNRQDVDYPHRKQLAVGLARAVIETYYLADLEGVDLAEVIEAKLAYNAQRADHKPENRVLPGGKAY